MFYYCGFTEEQTNTYWSLLTFNIFTYPQTYMSVQVLLQSTVDKI